LQVQPHAVRESVGFSTVHAAVGQRCAAPQDADYRNLERPSAGPLPGGHVADDGIEL